MTERGPKIPRGLVLASVALMVGTTLVLAVRHDAARDLWKALTAVPVSALAIAGLFVLVQWICQALRMWALVPRAIPLTLGRTVYAYAVGSWFNILVPARAGDAVKVMLMNRVGNERIASLPEATGVLLADKIIDIGSFVLLCAAGGLLDLLRVGLHVGPIGRDVLIGAGALVVVVAIAARRAPRRWLKRLRLKRLRRLREELAIGLSALTDPVRVLGSSLFCLAAWTAELLAIRVLCAASGYPRSLPQLLLGLALLNLGTSVPISVASVGIYEAALAFGLRQTGIPLASAVVIATLHHALELLITSLGAAGARLGVSASDVFTAKQPVDG